ncbi:MAG: hypothetical protein R3F37_21930 [Candidatus Competibacteraceae bacterium]
MLAVPGQSVLRKAATKAVSQLGTLEEFRELVQKARQHGIDIALDIALQCAPDHPYVEEHPDWFRWRPDGTVQYAENRPRNTRISTLSISKPPIGKRCGKKSRGIFEFWVEQGVRIFRVDNPHTETFHHVGMADRRN